MFSKCYFSEELMAQTRKLVQYIDENIKKMTKSMSKNSPQQYALLKAQFSVVSDAEINQVPMS
jgi:hypothetical protein